MGFEHMLKEIKSFDETKDLILQHHEISTVYQYIKKKRLFDPNDPNQHFEPVLKKDPIRVEYVPSKAFEKQMEKTTKLRHINTTFHSNYILDAKLSDFDVFNDERKEALNKVNQFIENFQTNRFLKGLYFYGQNRTGKTFLLSAIANELSYKNVDIVFAYVPDLIRIMHASINEGTLESNVKVLKECELLILDDLGGAFMSTWFRDQVFGTVIQYRLSVGLPVLISSNLKLLDLSNYFVDPKVENDKYNAVRLFTRIRELTDKVTLTEERYKKIGNK